MRTSIAQATALILSSALGLFAPPAAAVAVGDAPPAFDLTGRVAAVKLSDYAGKTVYLDFWASWCGPCKQSFPWMNEMQARYGAQGLRVVAINVDQKADDAQAFLRKTPAQFDLAFDPTGQTPKAYAIKAMPTSVLIGPDGKVLSVHSGFKDQDRNVLEQQIRQALRLQ
jgi:cytochrome c biogenesis protein CcmG/thiol:disulfide interchange protein DsbE